MPGNDVNLASRLEGLCKLYGVGIIIGDKTRAEVTDYATLELDLVMVKGKTEPEHAHALLGGIELAKTAKYQELVTCQTAFLTHYRAGSFAKALSLIEACEQAAAAAGWEQGYYDMMRARVDELIKDPPADWTGVYVAREK